MEPNISGAELDALKDSHGGHVDPKVATGGAAMAAATVIVFICGQFGLEIPGEVGAAIATLIGFAAGYLR